MNNKNVSNFSCKSILLPQFQNGPSGRKREREHFSENSTPSKLLGYSKSASGSEKSAKKQPLYSEFIAIPHSANNPPHSAADVIAVTENVQRSTSMCVVTGGNRTNVKEVPLLSTLAGNSNFINSNTETQLLIPIEVISNLIQTVSSGVPFTTVSNNTLPSTTILPVISGTPFTNALTVASDTSIVSTVPSRNQSTVSNKIALVIPSQLAASNQNYFVSVPSFSSIVHPTAQSSKSCVIILENLPSTQAESSQLQCATVQNKSSATDYTLDTAENDSAECASSETNSVLFPLTGHPTEPEGLEREDSSSSLDEVKILDSITCTGSFKKISKCNEELKKDCVSEKFEFGFSNDVADKKKSITFINKIPPPCRVPDIETVSCEKVLKQESLKYLYSKNVASVKSSLNLTECSKEHKIPQKNMPIINLSRKETAKYRFQCSLCSYSAVTKTLVKIHQKYCHPNSNGLVVRGSGKDITEATNVTIDLSHKVKPFKCSLLNCKFTTCDGNNLLNHISTHKNLTCYKCHECSESYPLDKLENLVHHYRIHGYNDFHCLYCPHGTDHKKDILLHLCNNHADKTPKLLTRTSSISSPFHSMIFENENTANKDFANLSIEPCNLIQKPPTSDVQDNNIEQSRIGKDIILNKEMSRNFHKFFSSSELESYFLQNHRYCKIILRDIKFDILNDIAL